jgi:hypothetical protein
MNAQGDSVPVEFRAFRPAHNTAPAGFSAAAGPDLERDEFTSRSFASEKPDRADPLKPVAR